METRLFSSGSLALVAIRQQTLLLRISFDGAVSDEYIPFSDLKPRLNNYITGLWQNEWDNYPLNKLHKISPKINEFLKSFPSNRREETVLSRLHIGHSYMTHFFVVVERRRSSLLYSIQWVAFFRTRVIALLRFDWCQEKKKVFMQILWECS